MKDYFTVKLHTHKKEVIHERLFHCEATHSQKRKLFMKDYVTVKLHAHNNKKEVIHGSSSFIICLPVYIYVLLFAHYTNTAT